MGWWGNMGGPKQRGITIYSVSPFAQKPLAGTMHAAVFNTARRVRSQLFYIGLPVTVGYAIYAWARQKNEWYNSKEGQKYLASLEEN